MYGVFAVDLELSKNKIIQIGFYKVSARGKITELCINVKPHRGFKIDPFVSELTKITQQDLDSGVSLKDAMNIIRKAGVCDCTGITWGKDFATIAGHCQTYGVDNPFLKADTLVDGQRVVQALLGLRDQPALSTMLEKAPKDVQKRYNAGAHNALVDACATYWVFRGLV